MGSCACRSFMFFFDTSDYSQLMLFWHELRLVNILLLQIAEEEKRKTGIVSRIGGYNID